jgi:hypothetical protein
MKGVNLSPLNLFMIALLILVVSVAFGIFKRKEGMTTAEGDVPRELFVPYSESRPLVLIHTVTYTDEHKQKVYYDELYGNIVVAPEVQELTTTDIVFHVVDRSGDSQKYTSTDGKPSTDLKTNLANMNTIKQLITDSSGRPANFSWSYGEKGFGIVYVTWEAYTTIYTMNTFDRVMGPIYQSVYTSAYARTIIDPTIIGSPLIQTDTNVSDYSAPPNTVVPIRDFNAYQITQNVYFNHNKGLILRKINGYDATEMIAPTGSLVDYDNRNHAMVVATKFKKNGVPCAIIIVLSYTGSNITSPYQLFTTARITHNDESSSNFQHPFSEKYPTADSGISQNPNYILKTEIVPPVCPMCPSPCDYKTPTTTPPTPTRCGVSVNSTGQIVDCSGNVITVPPAPTTPSFTTSPSTSTIGGSISSSVKSISDVAGTAVSTAGNVADQTISTAGGLVSQAGTDVTTLASGLGKDVADITTGLGSDVTKLGSGLIGGATGLVSQTVGTAGALVGKTIDSATGLAYGAGSGLANMMHPNQTGYGYPGQSGYPSQYGYPSQSGYPSYQGAPIYPGYYGGPGQQMCGPPTYPAQTSDYMPITNDFSQFT